MRRLLFTCAALLVMTACSTSHRTSKPAEGNAPTSDTLPSNHCVLGVVPDPRCTPGTTNTAVTQATIHQTICVSGWTSRIRPLEQDSAVLKTLAATRYAIPAYSSKNFEGDHFIPLELGGGPLGPMNFWDEPHTITGPDGKPAGSHVKDAFENYLHRAVCDGMMTLTDAQQAILTNWYAAYNAAGRPEG